MKDWLWLGGSRLARFFKDKQLYVMVYYNEQDKLWEWKLYHAVPYDWKFVGSGKSPSARLAIEQSTMEVEV